MYGPSYVECTLICQRQSLIYIWYILHPHYQISVFIGHIKLRWYILNFTQYKFQEQLLLDSEVYVVWT